MLERGGVPVAEELTPGPWEPYYFRSPRGARQCWGVGAPNVGLMGVASNIRNAPNARLISAAPDLLALARIIGSAYPNDPGTSDLDDEQAVTITLGTVRRAWAALAKVDR